MSATMEVARTRPRKARGDSLLRLFHTANALRGRRFRAKSDDLWRDVCERQGTSWCYRSIVRDLELLELLGYAERLERGYGEHVRWRWTGPDAVPDVEALARLESLAESGVSMKSQSLSRGWPRGYDANIDGWEYRPTGIDAPGLPDNAGLIAIMSASARVLGWFDDLTKAVDAFNLWPQANSMMTGGKVIARKEVRAEA